MNAAHLLSFIPHSASTPCAALRHGQQAHACSPKVACTPTPLVAVIWDALKAACEAEDDATARLIIETAGIIVAAPDMSICYDERGGWPRALLFSLPRLQSMGLGFCAEARLSTS